MAKFYKKQNETFLQYRKRINDKISSSFCAAKWYNATIWLNEGKTSSCHHPKQHSIPKKELINNPSALHNTSFKKQRRKEMLEGIRPDECEYCWKVEDISKDHISDRVYKTAIYDESEISECKSKFGWESNVPLKTLEISFDSNCNLLVHIVVQLIQQLGRMMLEIMGFIKLVKTMIIIQCLSLVNLI